jgi:hypothetical protein
MGVFFVLFCSVRRFITKKCVGKNCSPFFPFPSNLTQFDTSSGCRSSILILNTSPLKRRNRSLFVRFHLFRRRRRPLALLEFHLYCCVFQRASPQMQSFSPSAEERFDELVLFKTRAAAALTPGQIVSPGAATRLTMKG